jgi:hypothetical protein
MTTGTTSERDNDDQGLETRRVLSPYYVFKRESGT